MGRWLVIFLLIVANTYFLSIYDPETYSFNELSKSVKLETPFRNGLAAHCQHLSPTSIERITHKLPCNKEFVETDDPSQAGQALDPEREIQEPAMLELVSCIASCI